MRLAELEDPGTASAAPGGDEAMRPGDLARQDGGGRNAGHYVAPGDQIAVVAVVARVRGDVAREIQLLHLAERVVTELRHAALVIADRPDAAVDVVAVLANAGGRLLRAPPADATKTASGLIYKRLGAGTKGAQPRSDDTVLVRYTGWRQRTGETFFTTQGRAQPIAIDLAHAALEFREALPLLRVGETAVVWMPPRPGTREPVAYQVELVEVIASRPAEAAGGKASG